MRCDMIVQFPLATSFTDDQRAVYEGVLNAQRRVMAMMHPGVRWTDCHKAAEEEVLKALVAVGVLIGDVHEMLENRIGALFLPHGLGHLIGCDTHDVGGYIEGTPERIALPGLKKLRTARFLEANMVLTVEPGCYFVDYLLDTALANPEQAKYINAEVLKRFRGFGGVRLEDVVVVSAHGPPRNLTNCPRTVKEVESVRNGGQWPPAVDEAPYLHRQWTRLSDDGNAMIDVHIPSA